MRGGSFLGRCLLALSSLTLTLVGLEIAVRYGFLSPEVYRSTKLETLATSRRGVPDFREPGYRIPPRSDALRILVVGDSFAWGGGLHPEDAFPHRLERRLNAARMRPRFEVVNWSRPGWNTVLQEQSLRDRLDEVEPDLLILSFVLNDAEPTDPERLKELRRPLERRQSVAGRGGWWFEHSALYRLVWTRLENSRQRRVLTAFYHSLFRGEHWHACRRALRRLRDAAHQRSIPMLLVVFPVFDSHIDDSYPYAKLHAKLQRVGTELGLPVLDLLSVYRGVDGRRLALEPFTDGHPSELAHRLAADAIPTFLALHRLLPRPRGLRAVSAPPPAPDPRPGER